MILTHSKGNFTYGGPSQPVQLSLQLIYQQVNCSSETVPPAFSGNGQLTVRAGDAAISFETVSATYDKCSSSWAIAADAGDQPWNVEGLTLDRLSASFLITYGESSSSVLNGYVSGSVALAGTELGVTVNFDSIVGVKDLVLNFAYTDTMVDAHADLIYNRTCGPSGVRTEGGGDLSLSGIADTTLNVQIYMLYNGDCATSDLLWSLTGSSNLSSILCLFIIYEQL